MNQVVVSLTISGRGKASGVETTWDVKLVWMIRDGGPLRGQAFVSKEEALGAVGLRK